MKKIYLLSVLILTIYSAKSQTYPQIVGQNLSFTDVHLGSRIEANPNPFTTNDFVTFQYLNAPNEAFNGDQFVEVGQVLEITLDITSNTRNDCRIQVYNFGVGNAHVTEYLPVLEVGQSVDYIFSVENKGTTKRLPTIQFWYPNDLEFTITESKIIDPCGNLSDIIACDAEIVKSLHVGGFIDASGYLINGEAFEPSLWSTSGQNIHFSTGGVGIGTDELHDYMLAVGGSIISEEVKVKLKSNWPDFVFEKPNEVRTLEEVENYISKNKHLPEIPSASEVENNGINLGEMDAKLLQKIEELTLYMIEMNKKIKTQGEEIQVLRDKNIKLEKDNSVLKSEVSALRKEK